MENQQQDSAPLGAGSSEEVLIPQVTTRRSGSNGRAFKVAGLTVLACLLLSSQALMAYMVFSHRGQIDSLQKSADKLRKLSSRAQVAPARMSVPMSNMLMQFTDDESDITPEKTKTKTPLVKLENIVMVTLEKQVKDLLQGSQLPQFNETFMANLKSLKTQMEENEWKGLETWMRHWLIFLTAQQTPPPPPTPQSATGLQTKCNLQASSGRKLIGIYRPQCDKEGRYVPTQCWPATGFCWCVTADGDVIPGTSTRERPSCGGGAVAPARRSMVALPSMMEVQLLPVDE